MKFVFKRRPALRSVLVAGVIAASFIIQPATAQSPAPLSKSCRQRMSALIGEYVAKLTKSREHFNSIGESQYRKLCDYSRTIHHPIYPQYLAALNEMRRAGCWNQIQEGLYSTIARLEKSDQDAVEDVSVAHDMTGIGSTRSVR